MVFLFCLLTHPCEVNKRLDVFTQVEFVRKEPGATPRPLTGRRQKQEDTPVDCSIAASLFRPSIF